MTYHSKYSQCMTCGTDLPRVKDRRQNPTRCRECAKEKASHWKMKTNDFKPSIHCPIEQSHTAFA